jgi:hypothetical protein
MDERLKIEIIEALLRLPGMDEPAARLMLILNVRVRALLSRGDSKRGDFERILDQLAPMGLKHVCDLLENCTQLMKEGDLACKFHELRLDVERTIAPSPSPSPSPDDAFSPQGPTNASSQYIDRRRTQRIVTERQPTRGPALWTLVLLGIAILGVSVRVAYWLLSPNPPGPKLADTGAWDAAGPPDALLEILVIDPIASKQSADTHKRRQHSNRDVDRAISENPTGLQPRIPSALQGTICETAIKDERVQEIIHRYPELDDFECIGGNRCKPILRYNAGLHDPAVEIQRILQPLCPIDLSTKI